MGNLSKVDDNRLRAIVIILAISGSSLITHKIYLTRKKLKKKIEKKLRETKQFIFQIQGSSILLIGLVIAVIVIANLFLFSLGNLPFDMLIEKNKKVFAEHGIKKIVTNCPGCFHIFGKYYGIEAEHISVLIWNRINKLKVKKKFDEVPTGALGVYTYAQRLSQGLKQLMCGSRKFKLEFMTRNDLTALTKEAAEISGIPYVMDVDKEEAEKILNS